MDQLVKDLEELRAHARNHVQGCYPLAPTTPSSGVAWYLNLTHGISVVGSVAQEFIAQTDYVLFAGNVLAVGQSCVAALVIKNTGSVVSQTHVFGVVAATGAEVAPSAATITAALAVGDIWIRTGETTLNRSGGGYTQTYDGTKRPILGVTLSPNFGDYSWLPNILG